MVEATPQHRPSSGSEHARQGPLNGITVVDLTRVLAGPYCTMLLSELGARVIKIEEPGKGDDARAFGPFVQGRPTYFNSVNRNKESIALDLRDPADRTVFESLLAQADVVTENFRPGVMEKLGYGWETLHARFPRLIYASVSAYGHTGPDCDQPGYDLVIQALSGLMSITGDEGSGPCRAGISLADVGAGLFAAVAINGALVHRERTGKTTKIDMSMLDCMMTLLEAPVNRYLATGEIVKRNGAVHPGIMPFESFATADGHLVLTCGNDKLYRLLCGAIERPDLAEASEYDTNIKRVEHRKDLHEEIEQVLLRRSTDYWCAHFRACGVPAARINNMAQALESPQVRARNMVVESIDPVLGATRLVGSPFKMSAFDDPPTRRAAPDLDQNRAAILAELGLSGGEV